MGQTTNNDRNSIEIGGGMAKMGGTVKEYIDVRSSRMDDADMTSAREGMGSNTGGRKRETSPIWSDAMASEDAQQMRG